VALSSQEQAELAQLEKEVGNQANLRISPSVKGAGLSKSEQDELQRLEGQVGHLAPKNQVAQAPGYAQTALEHGANTAALGYLPQLQAAAQPAIFKALNAITGQSVEPDSYVDSRDANIKRLQAEAKANPKTSLASDITGGAVGAMATPIPGIGPAKGLLGAVGKGMAYGAGYGALANPGDVEGEVDPLQLSERAKNSAKGLAVGGVTGGATDLTANALENLYPSLKNLARGQALKASGARLKDLRVLEGNDRAEKLADYALNNGLVKAGDTAESIAGKAAAKNKAAGEGLDKVYSEAQAALDQNAGAVKGGFSPVVDRDNLLEQANQSLGNSEGKASALDRLGKYLDQIKGDYGDRVLSPREANDVKGAMDDVVNYERNPLRGSPTSEEAFKSGRGYVGNKIADQVQELGDMSGNPELADSLSKNNSDYGMSKRLSGMSKDKAMREAANRMFGLTDTISGGVGSAAGLAANSAMGGDYKHAGEMGLAGMLAGMVANKVGRTYGPAAIADYANMASRPVGLINPALQEIAPAISSPALTRSLIEEGLINQNLKKQKPKEQTDNLKLAQ
jgi:hypothetical protein